MTRRGLLLTAFGARAVRAAALNPWLLWYRRPAARWLEALPVGNGRIGAMVFGGVRQERLGLNESTVWAGRPGDHDPAGGPQELAEARRLLLAGRYTEAEEYCRQHLIGRKLSYGTHVPLGDLRLDFAHGESAGGYRRELDMDSGVAAVEYRAGGVVFRREVFVSAPDQVLVVRLAASRRASVSLDARLESEHRPSVSAAGRDGLLLQGRCAEGGVRFGCLLRVMNDGGTVSAAGSGLRVENADAVTLLIGAGTDYPGGVSPETAGRHVAAAAAQAYGTLRERHTADHRRLFRRAAIDLGPAPSPGRATDERLEAVKKGGEDAQLAAQFFQYARYLLIAGSRPGAPLPMNLQGIWNDNLAANMPWTCDYHLDINTQMNYWPAESANLAECHEPLIRFIDRLREHGRKTAKKVYGARGWVAHVFTNAWGYTAPGWSTAWGVHLTAGAWLCMHVWDHYSYSGDREYLAKTAYPILKEAAEFFLDHLFEHPGGWLVSGPSNSPENRFRTAQGEEAHLSLGPTCDRVCIDDLFAHVIEAGRILGIDSGFREQVRKARARLSPLRIGRHGQLQEWLEDFDEPMRNHRHTSHLLALYPCDQITPRRTPELARAAEVTIRRRLESGNWEDVEWSRANLINFHARLLDGENAARSVFSLLRTLTAPNLLTVSPAGIAGARIEIFVVDGNTGAGAGIAEMLLQSHSGEVCFLPALPGAWGTGSFRGLRARGGLEVDLEWRKGRAVSAVLRAGVDGEHRLRAPAGQRISSVRVNGRGQRAAPPEDGTVTVRLQAGQRCRVSFT